MTLEDIKLYLPKYLSPESEDELYKNLKSFPSNIDKRIFSDFSADSSLLFQGDGINNLLVINLPEDIIKKAPAILISNTCDISPLNKRFYPSRLVYAPLFNLEKYKNLLLEVGIYKRESIEDHLRSIREQRVTQIFYLPKYGKIEDSLVFLDRLNNCPTDFLQVGEIQNRRLFSLSMYGLYLFLFKLSIHLTRITENVDRN